MTVRLQYWICPYQLLYMEILWNSANISPNHGNKSEYCKERFTMFNFVLSHVSWSHHRSFELSSDANFPKIFGNSKILKLSRKFCEIWKYENSDKNFCKCRTCCNRHSLNSQVLQWFWLEISKNVCYVPHWSGVSEVFCPVAEWWWRKLEKENCA